MKTIRYFIFFLHFYLANGGASAPLAPPLIAPLTSPKMCHQNDVIIFFYFQASTQNPGCSPA